MLMPLRPLAESGYLGSGAKGRLWGCGLVIEPLPEPLETWRKTRAGPAARSGPAAEDRAMQGVIMLVLFPTHG